jgi:DNA polymerase-1
MASLALIDKPAYPDDLSYQKIWCCDFEYHGADGGVPVPVCMVAKEVRSGQTYRVWQDELAVMDSPPFDTGPDALFVAYYASAEIGCFLALGWEPPDRILDLFTEFRAETNGLNSPHGNGLLGALGYFGLPMMGGDEKTTMRDLVLTGGPWTNSQQVAILDYCHEDVEALLRLLPALVGLFDDT